MPSRGTPIGQFIQAFSETTIDENGWGNSIYFYFRYSSNELPRADSNLYLLCDVVPARPHPKKGSTGMKALRGATLALGLQVNRLRIQRCAPHRPRMRRNRRRPEEPVRQ